MKTRKTRETGEQKVPSFSPNLINLPPFFYQNSRLLPLKTLKKKKSLAVKKTDRFSVKTLLNPWSPCKKGKTEGSLSVFLRQICVLTAVEGCKIPILGVKRFDF